MEFWLASLLVFIGLVALGIRANIWWYRMTPKQRKAIVDNDDRMSGEW